MSSPSPGVTRKRFRIAFSFAGEKREFVAQVAALLAGRFGRGAILYDAYHEAEFSSPDLAFELPKLYRDHSDLIVPVFCADYAGKPWCGLEWRTIYSLIMDGHAKQIMPTRFDLVAVDDLHKLAGFMELDAKTPHEAAENILKRLALNEDLAEDHYLPLVTANLAALNTSIPHNLPSLQPFFGREDELRIIREALEPESRIWGALIDGPGGMGKTSLAVRAAYAAPPEDFERIIFISLKTRELDDDGEHDLSGFILTGLQELYNELARELGHADIPKLPEEQRPRALLEALRGTKTLLILDNLESLKRSERGTILSLVKRLPPGCKAILTSRGRIGSGAEELILGELSQEAALETLAELAKHNPELAKTSEAERITLYKQTSGKPLLLRWTAGQIGRGHCRTFTDAIAFLHSCPKGNDPLEFIFGDLVEDFSAEEMKVIAALTYFTHAAKVKHIAPLAELEEDPCLKALNSLVNRSLVVPSEESQGYLLVPMVAAFLREHRREVVKETGDRLEKRAYALIVENGYQQHECFPVLDGAWESVAPALPLFLVRGGEIVQEVCDALSFFLSFSGRLDEWLFLSHQAEAKAVAEGKHANAGWRAHDAGQVHSFRHEADDVLVCAERAVAHWEKSSVGARERAFAIRLRGIGHQLKEDYCAAIAAYRRSLELLRSRSVQSQDIVALLIDLACAEYLSDDYEAAEHDFREAIGVARAIGDSEGLATSTGNLAALTLDREDWSRAESLVRDSLSLSEGIGRQQLIAANCRRLAKVLARQGKPIEGLPYAQRAVEIYIRLGFPGLDLALVTLHECEEAAAALPPDPPSP